MQSLMRPIRKDHRLRFELHRLWQPSLLSDGIRKEFSTVKQSNAYDFMLCKKHFFLLEFVSYVIKNMVANVVEKGSYDSQWYNIQGVFFQ